jgi:hypothetical protein
MPWVLPHSTSAIWVVVKLVVEGGDHWFVSDRLLNVDFLGDVIWVGEDVVIAVKE